jgi:hypothetical protein
MPIMSRDILESDWKVFKKLHPIAMERFFQRAVKEMRPLLDIDGTPAKDQFWDVLNLATERRKLAATLFDGPSRSSAILLIAGIARHKLVTEEELAGFSAEARQQIQGMLEFSRRH